MSDTLLFFDQGASSFVHCSMEINASLVQEKYGKFQISKYFGKTRNEREPTLCLTAHKTY